MALVTKLAQRFTYEDLAHTPDDGYRREIVGGSLIVSPSPIARHQRAVVHVVARLFSAETPETMVVAGPYDWRQPDGDVYVPDALVALRADVDPAGPLGPGAVPLLVVEILSPSNAPYDRLLKREVYARRCVPAYWIIDASQPSLLALRLADTGYEVEFDGGGVFTTDSPFAFSLAVAELAR